MQLNLTTGEVALLVEAVHTASRDWQTVLRGRENIAANRAASRARRDGLVPQRAQPYDGKLAHRILEARERLQQLADLEAILTERLGEAVSAAATA
jgi:hypothetical protein